MLYINLLAGTFFDDERDVECSVWEYASLGDLFDFYHSAGGIGGVKVS
jgi:hypothetical protein